MRLYTSISDAYIRHHYGYSNTSNGRRLWPLIYLHPGARAEADFSVLHQKAASSATRLLDVGCGSGSHLKYLSNLGWDAVEGVDTDPSAVALASDQGLRVACGTLLSQAYPDSTFDVITMSHVIEHLHDPVAVLQDCHRILRPGGKLLLLTPNMQSWGHQLFRDAWLHLDPPRHLHLFNPHNLRTTVARSGSWSIASLRTTVRAAGPTFDASLNIRKWGKHNRSFFQASLWRQGGAHAYYYLEAFLSVFGRWWGEEILLEAEKPNPSTQPSTDVRGAAS